MEAQIRKHTPQVSASKVCLAQEGKNQSETLSDLPEEREGSLSISS